MAYPTAVAPSSSRLLPPRYSINNITFFVFCALENKLGSFYFDIIFGGNQDNRRPGNMRQMGINISEILFLELLIMIRNQIPLISDNKAGFFGLFY